MSPYKSFTAAAKTYLESIPFLNFLLSASIYIFAGGGLLFLLGLYIPSTLVYDMFMSLGSLLLWAGLLLSIVKGDVLTIVIAGGAVSLGSLIGWLVKMFGGYGYSLLGYSFGLGGYFAFTPFLYFSIFGAIAIVVLIRAEKFAQQRAASAMPRGLPCPRCGNTVPFGAAFCPACAAPAPQYAPPPPSQYAPQYAPPPSQYAPQYAPPPPSQYAPQYAPPPAAPEPAAPEPAAPEPAAPEPPAAPHKNCVSCGAELPADAVFCGKCGAHQ